MARALSVPKISPYLAALERRRRQIPLEKYLALLDSAASTGFLPKLNPDGRPTGEFDQVGANQRIGILHTLLDKGMPNRQEAAPLPEDIEAGVKTIDVTKLDDDELEKIIAAGDVKTVELEQTPDVAGNPNLPAPATAPEPSRASSPGAAAT